MKYVLSILAATLITILPANALTLEEFKNELASAKSVIEQEHKRIATLCDRLSKKDRDILAKSNILFDGITVADLVEDAGDSFGAGIEEIGFVLENTDKNLTPIDSKDKE